MESDRQCCWEVSEPPIRGLPQLRARAEAPLTDEMLEGGTTLVTYLLKFQEMSQRGGPSIQPPSSTNPRGVNAANERRKKQPGTAVITLDDLDRIRSQIVRTKEDGYEFQRETMR